MGQVDSKKLQQEENERQQRKFIKQQQNLKLEEIDDEELRSIDPQYFSRKIRKNQKDLDLIVNKMVSVLSQEIFPHLEFYHAIRDKENVSWLYEQNSYWADRWAIIKWRQNEQIGAKVTNWDDESEEQKVPQFGKQPEKYSKCEYCIKLRAFYAKEGMDELDENRLKLMEKIKTIHNEEIIFNATKQQNMDEEKKKLQENDKKKLGKN